MSDPGCEVCGGRTEVHLTEAGPDGTKRERHYCAEHAAAAGVPISPEKIQAIRSATEAFAVFVVHERRVPTEDELAELGLIGTFITEPPGSQPYREKVQHLNAMAESILKHPRV